MTDKEKLLIVGAIDDLLIEELGYRGQFTEDERGIILDYCEEVFDTNSPKDVRESMTKLARKLYGEVFD